MPQRETMVAPISVLGENKILEGTTSCESIIISQ